VPGAAAIVRVGGRGATTINLRTVVAEIEVGSSYPTQQLFQCGSDSQWESGVEKRTLLNSGSKDSQV
jgi:hypothetical protein